ncbi:MAG: hypothetical protein AAGN15_06415 [Cyanobacteria bacterium J06581_3]
MVTHRRVERYFTVSAYALLIIAIAIAIVAYLVSPLRDPSFVPQSANAGATVSWLRPERYWIIGLNTLAITLATNTTVLRWLKWRTRRAITPTNRGRLGMLFRVLTMCGLWLVIFYGTWVVSMYFLLWQYILD